MSDTMSEGQELARQADTYTSAMFGSIHRQHQAAVQAAAQEAANMALRLAQQAEVIDGQSAEIERLTARVAELEAGITGGQPAPG